MLSENKNGIIFLYNGEYGVSTDENGLYYMRARYYNSEIKRFINQDVLIGTITDSPTLNRYAYVEGNPISLADPFGLSPAINWSNLGHAALDVLGFIPVVGFAFDAINAVWYWNEGNKFMAISSAISALPGAGDAIGAGLKSLKLGNLACKISKFAHVAGNAAKMVEGAAVIGTVINNNLEYYVYSDEEREINWGQLAVDLFTVGLEVFTIKNAANGLKNAEAASWCFVAGTLVATEDGQKPIEEIQAGDKVLSENPETGEVDYKTVEETYVNETTELVHVFVNGEEIVTTPSHPFYVPKFGWTLAVNLRAGDILVLSNGEYVVVEAIQHEILESPIKVYNFEVQDFHTYFVGKNSVLVHNKCYRDEFFQEFPDEKGKVVVHHSIEQQILNMDDFAGLFTQAELNSIDKLRGIPKAFNSTIHLSEIRKKWNLFYNNVEAGNIAPTKENVEEFAKLIVIVNIFTL